MSINQMTPPQQIQNQQVYVNNPYQQQKMLQQVQMINPHQQVQQGQAQMVQQGQVKMLTRDQRYKRFNNKK